MQLIELYDQIKNPLDDENVMTKLLETYSKSIDNDSSFYSNILKIQKKVSNNTNEQHINYFYSTLFNKWKNSIVLLTEEKFIKLRDKNIYDDNFITLRNYLMTIPDVKTKKEADDIFLKKYDNEQLNIAMKRYRWDSREQQKNYIHVFSKYLTADQDENPCVEHRLYLNVDSPDIYELLSYIINKFEQKKLSYHFKIDKVNNRDDNLVIYSSTENLANYIETLKEIKEEHPDLISRVKEPPILTGKIDNWIGYGSEPPPDEYYELQSFNQVRAVIIEKAITDTTKDWVSKNLNMKIIYNNKMMSLKDYFAVVATNTLTNKINTLINNQEEKDALIKYKNIELKQSDLNDYEKLHQVFEKVKNDMDLYIPKVLDGTYNEYNEEVNIYLENNEKKRIQAPYNLKNIVMKMSKTIYDGDTVYKQNLKNNINESSSKVGIDINKYCFDEEAVNRMKYIDYTNNNNVSNLENNEFHI